MVDIERPCACGSKNPDKFLNKVSALRTQALARDELSDSPLLNLSQPINLGVVCHFITSNPDWLKPENQSAVRECLWDILETLNKDFGNPCSSDRVNAHLTPTKFPLLRSAENVKRYKDCFKRACATNIRFIPVQDPVVKSMDKNSKLVSTDTAKWDEIIKRKISPAVRPEKYLNIWFLADVECKLLGYAQFPFDDESPKNFDGVVYSVTGFPYHMYKTLTHEVGHYLGLLHTFHSWDNVNFDDEILDTPYQKAPTFGNPYLRSTWESVDYNGKRFFTDYFNYMNYTDDVAMAYFTKNQCERIREMIALFRSEQVMSSKEAEAAIRKFGKGIFSEPMDKVLALMDRENIGQDLPSKLEVLDGSVTNKRTSDTIQDQHAAHLSPDSLPEETSTLIEKSMPVSALSIFGPITDFMVSVLGPYNSICFRCIE